MANHRDDHLFSNFLNALENYWDFGVSLPDRQGAVFSPPSVLDYSYSQQYPLLGQTGHSPPFLPCDIVEQCIASSDDSTGRAEVRAISDENVDASLSQQLKHTQLEGQLSEQEYGPLLHASVVVSRPLNSQNSLAIVTSNELSALTPQNDTFYHYEGQTFCQQPSLRVMHAGQNKVRCTVPGCLKVVRKDGLTRHANETHLRIVRGICARCGRGFRRRYLKVKHEVTCRG